MLIPHGALRRGKTTSPNLGTFSVDRQPLAIDGVDDHKPKRVDNRWALFAIGAIAEDSNMSE